VTHLQASLGTSEIAIVGVGDNDARPGTDFAVHAKMYGKLQEGDRLFLADSVTRGSSDYSVLGRRSRGTQQGIAGSNPM
jgi:hypothetical protein